MLPGDTKGVFDWLSVQRSAMVLMGTVVQSSFSSILHKACDEEGESEWCECVKMTTECLYL